MPLFSLRDYVTDEVGVGVSNIRCRLFKVNADRTRITPHVSEVFTDSNGRWEFLNIDPLQSPAGFYDVEIANLSTGQIRWRHGDVQLQIDSMVGRNSLAPIQNNSIASWHYYPGSVGGGALAQQTMSDTSPPPVLEAGGSYKDSLFVQLSALANRIKAITGEDSWTKNPITNIKAIKAHMDDASIHITPGSTGDEAIGIVQATSNSGAPIGSVTANSKKDTFFLREGTNIGLSVSGDTITISNTASDGGGGGGSNTAAPQLGSVVAGSSGAPPLNSGQYKIQTGTKILNTGSQFLQNLALAGPIQGFASIIINDGDWDAHGLPLILSLSNAVAGTAPYLTIKAIRGDGTTHTGASVRINYWVMYW